MKKCPKCGKFYDDSFGVCVSCPKSPPLIDANLPPEEVEKIEREWYEKSAEKWAKKQEEWEKSKGKKVLDVWEKFCDNTVVRVIFNIVVWGLIIWAIIYIALDDPQSTFGGIVIVILGVIFLAIQWVWNNIKDIGFGGIVFVLGFIWITSSYFELTRAVRRIEGKVDRLLSKNEDYDDDLY